MYRVQAFVAGIKDPEFDRLLLRLAAQHLVHKWHKCLNSKASRQMQEMFYIFYRLFWHLKHLRLAGDNI